MSCCAAVVGWVLTLVPAFDATPSAPVDDVSPPPQPASSAADSAAAASDAVTARDSPARSPVDTLDVFMTMKALLQGDERHRLKQWGFKRCSLSESRFVIYGWRETNSSDFPLAAGELIQNRLKRQKHLPETQGFQFKGGSLIDGRRGPFSQSRRGGSRHRSVSPHF
ncbi:conserved exported hypothetical protein [Ralstonia solanacearum K60]|nr:conserved exported hypothetical protein [Ralstonia solanacearum K60]